MKTLTLTKKDKSVLTIEGLRSFTDQDNNVFLSLEDAAIGLGFIQTKKGKTYVKYERVRTYLQGFIDSPKVGKNSYIPESAFYLLAMKANNEKAKDFQLKVATEILPTIRKTGGYISENTTTEQVRHLAENNLIVMINEGKQVGKRLKTVFVDCTPIEIQDKLDYIYPKVKTGNREYFLKRLRCNIDEIQTSYRQISKGFSTTVFDGYTKISLFAADEALKYKNRSAGKLLAIKDKKLNRMSAALYQANEFKPEIVYSGAIVKTETDLYEVEFTAMDDFNKPFRSGLIVENINRPYYKVSLVEHYKDNAGFDHIDEMLLFHPSIKTGYQAKEINDINYTIAFDKDSGTIELKAQKAK